MHGNLRTVLGVATAIGLVGTGVVLSRGTPVAHAGPGVPTDGTIADVAERVIDGVVNISSSHPMQRVVDVDPFFNDPNSPAQGAPDAHKALSMGSGVIVSTSGRILTNWHVVDGATDIEVTLHDGSEQRAKVIGHDARGDVAVLQLEGKVPGNLHPLSFGNSSAMRLGDIVLAIGDPMGVGKSVTMGIVSAKGRASVGIEDYEDFIQTDAAINPGNSGGALVNLKGELIGINTAIASKSGGYQGIGFAIPSNMAKPIMDMLLADGHVSRGYLGVDIVTVNSEIAQQQSLGNVRGVMVSAIQTGSPAAVSGLVAGDVVTAVDGTEVRDSGTLRNLIAMSKVGSTVSLDVFHKASGKRTIRAKLGELPDAQEVHPQRQPKQQPRRVPQPQPQLDDDE